MKISEMNNEKTQKIFEEIFFPKLEYRSIKKDYDNPENLNPSVCAECGGVCCKACGCHFSPDDFKDVSFDGLKKEIEKGYISIDYVDGEIVWSSIGIYILRARNQDSPIVDTGFRNRKPCILLTENGCKLDYEKRPTGGKLLIPNTISSFCHETTCKSKYKIVDCCYEWKPHQKVLYQLVKYFENKNISCSL